MYYDDEYDAPSTALESFIDYNDMNCNKYDYYEKGRNTAKNLCLCKYSNITSWLSFDDCYGNCDYKVRQLTEEEYDDILAIYKDQKEKYIERLKKYYERYSQHISTYGYWANR